MQIRWSKKGKVYRKASEILVLIKGVFNHETPVAENFTGEWRMLGQDGDSNIGSVTNPSPNMTRPNATEEKPQEKQTNKQKTRGHLHLPWKLSADATGLPETRGICRPLSWHTRTEHRGLNCHQARKTPRPWEPGKPKGYILHPPSPGAVESSLAQLHREEKPAGVELILAYTEETPLQGKGQSMALKAERKAWRPLNQYASSHYGVPPVSFIMNIYL